MQVFFFKLVRYHINIVAEMWISAKQYCSWLGAFEHVCRYSSVCMISTSLSSLSGGKLVAVQTWCMGLGLLYHISLEECEYIFVSLRLLGLRFPKKPSFRLKLWCSPAA